VAEYREVQEKELRKVYRSEQGSSRSHEERYESRLLDLEGRVAEDKNNVDS
jgi:hypothetical protein